jgi:hypothetical protein
MDIAITGDAVLAGATSPKLRVLMNKVQIVDWNRSGGSDELVTETVSFKAFLNQTDNKQSIAELTNVSTY